MIDYEKAVELTDHAHRMRPIFGLTQQGEVAVVLLSKIRELEGEIEALKANGAPACPKDPRDCPEFCGECDPVIAPPRPEALEEYANPANWEDDANGIARVWREPGSSTPDTYDGFDLASKALTQPQPEAQKPIVVERFADNGAHSHWDVVAPDGSVIASYPQEESQPEALEEDKSAQQWREAYLRQCSDSSFLAQKIQDLEAEREHWCEPLRAEIAALSRLAAKEGQKHTSCDGCRWSGYSLCAMPFCQECKCNPDAGDYSSWTPPATSEKPEDCN